VGNLLRHDEGVGIHLAQALEQMSLPEGVRVIDGGTGGLSLLYALEKTGKAIFLDAAEMSKDPGTFMRFTLEEARIAGDKLNLSLHELGLHQVLELAKSLGISCEVVFYGIQPKDLDWGIGLSPEVEQAIPHILDAVMREVQGLLP